MVAHLAASTAAASASSPTSVVVVVVRAIVIAILLAMVLHRPLVQRKLGHMVTRIPAFLVWRSVASASASLSPRVVAGNEPAGPRAWCLCQILLCAPVELQNLAHWGVRSSGGIHW